MNNQNDTPYRVRVRYSKTGNLRFIGHIDTHALFERALRRTKLPVRYTQGFNKRIRLNLASALPLGFISSAEMLDFWLNEPVDAAVLRERFQNALPAEIRVLDLYPIDNSLPSLQASLLSSDYLISLPEELNENDFIDDFENLLAQDSIPLTRKEKTVDVKPLIFDYAFNKDDSPNLTLKIKLSSTPSGNLRPDDLLKLLEIDPADCMIERIALNFETEEETEKENG